MILLWIKACPNLCSLMGTMADCLDLLFVLLSTLFLFLLVPGTASTNQSMFGPDEIDIASPVTVIDRESNTEESFANEPEESFANEEAQPLL